MIFVLGLCLGSFVNMLVYRVARKYKLEKDKFKVKNNNRSHCDFCGKQLSWYENVPVISWLLQGGKSRCCLKNLSGFYPIVELITGGLMVSIFNRFNILSGRFSFSIEI
jgi:prepilin signal peptidase PulO-like enzyme (type II secretory pathway)